MRVGPVHKREPVYTHVEWGVPRIFNSIPNREYNENFEDSYHIVVPDIMLFRPL